MTGDLSGVFILLLSFLPLPLPFRKLILRCNDPSPSWILNLYTSSRQFIYHPPTNASTGAAPREIYLQQFPHVENLPINLELSVDWSKKSNLLNFWLWRRWDAVVGRKKSNLFIYDPESSSAAVGWKKSNLLIFGCEGALWLAQKIQPPQFLRVVTMATASETSCTWCKQSPWREDGEGGKIYLIARRSPWKGRHLKFFNVIYYYLPSILMIRPLKAGSRTSEDRGQNKPLVWWGNAVILPKYSLQCCCQ
jgi:hypothetical protein